MELLNVSKLSKDFGGVKAVQDIDIVIEENEITGIIGPNGAGKTTFFNLLTGIYTPSSGEITYHLQKDVTSRQLKPQKMAKYGVARTFQNIRLFKEMTVFDNVLIGYHCNMNYGVLPSILRLPSFFSGEKEASEKVTELLRIFNLLDKKDEKAKNLSYGDQRKVEIARALAANPKVLLLDEPAAGMNPNETNELTKLIRWVKDEFKLTVVLIEHDMSLVMKLCDKIFVFDYGHLIAEGNPESIQNNERVIKAYLGGDYVAQAK
jgi:branched-chain amino acid transport system ATP-binding protein